MKVFHIFSKISNKYQPYNQRLIDNLKRSKELQIITVSTNDTSKPKVNEEILHLKRLGFLDKWKGYFNGFFYLFKYEGFSIKNVKDKVKIQAYSKYAFLLNNKNAIFHFHNLHKIDQFILKILKQNDIKFVVSLRGNDISIKPLLNDKVKNFTIDVLKNAWKIHAVCESLKLDAINVFGIDANKIQVIYRTPNIEDIMNIKKTKNAVSEINIVTISRIHWKKCIPESLMAVRQLINQGCAVNYHIIGGFVSLEEYNKTQFLIQKLKLNSSVVLHGYLEESEFNSILSKMNIFWLTSINEGIPNVLYFALKSGFPIIASKTDGIPEILKNEINGLLFSPYNFNDLVEKSKRIINDEDLRFKLQDNATQTILQNTDKELKQYLSLYLD